MRDLQKLFAACAVSLGLYAILTQILHKPLTIDTIREMMEVKVRYASSAHPPRFFILAGSNGRMSHRAETMEPILGRPAINLSIAAGIGPDYLFHKYTSVFQAGDAVYLPFEYSQYLQEKAAAYGGPDRHLLVRQERELLRSLDWERIARSFFALDLSFVIQGAGEMALHSRGVSRRFGLDTLTPNGDEMGHTREKGEPYKEFIFATIWTPPSGEQLKRQTFGKALLVEFVTELKRKGVQVIGGLPTTFADRPPTAGTVEALREFYAKELQADFLVLTNLSTYPRDCFFDTAYHLNEEWQIKHSEALAAELKPMLR